MADPQDPERGALHRELLALARAQLRAADLEDAGLFLQQTIEADLEARGVLESDDYVTVTHGHDGRLVARVVRVLKAIREEPPELALAAHAGREMDPIQRPNGGAKTYQFGHDRHSAYTLRYESQGHVLRLIDPTGALRHGARLRVFGLTTGAHDTVELLPADDGSLVGNLTNQHDHLLSGIQAPAARIAIDELELDAP